MTNPAVIHDLCAMIKHYISNACLAQARPLMMNHLTSVLLVTKNVQTWLCIWLLRMYNFRRQSVTWGDNVLTCHYIATIMFILCTSRSSKSCHELTIYICTCWWYVHECLHTLIWQVQLIITCYHGNKYKWCVAVRIEHCSNCVSRLRCRVWSAIAQNFY